MNEQSEPRQVLTLKPQIRNSAGLLGDGPVNYIFNEQGLVNWRAMINPKFLVPNLERTKETDISKLKDNEVLILLAGIREISALRGYNSVQYKVNSSSRDYCCVTCCINWLPNFETENTYISFESIADAHPGNTDQKMGLNYLASIAENRAFVRCVRNFLRINVRGKDELKGDYKMEDSNQNQSEEALTPKSIFNQLLKEKNISFDKVRDKLVKEGVPEAANYNSVDDIPVVQLFQLIGRLKNKKAKED